MPAKLGPHAAAGSNLKVARLATRGLAAVGIAPARAGVSLIGTIELAHGRKFADVG